MTGYRDKVCLSGYNRSTREFCIPRRRHHYGERLQILTFPRHSWSLSSEGSLACHTYCDTGHPFIMVISKHPWHSHLLLSGKQWCCLYLFLPHRSVTAGIRTPESSAFGANALTHCATAAVRIKCANEKKHPTKKTYSSK